jgi:hypothetical protein
MISYNDGDSQLPPELRCGDSVWVPEVSVNQVERRIIVKPHCGLNNSAIIQTRFRRMEDEARAKQITRIVNTDGRSVFGCRNRAVTSVIVEIGRKGRAIGYRRDDLNIYMLNALPNQRLDPYS